VRGLPITPLLTYQPEDGVHYAVTAVDARGRLADASPIRAVGWRPGQPITLHVVAGAVIVINRTPPDPPGRDSRIGPSVARMGRTAITQQGHLRLPAPIRHQCRLRSGSRLLVAAHPSSGVLAAFTTRVLDGVLRSYYQSLSDPDGARPATSDSATATHCTLLRDGQR
jgi:hypothetical protein